jgi:hypothetical protein
MDLKRPLQKSIMPLPLYTLGMDKYKQLNRVKVSKLYS